MPLLVAASSTPPPDPGGPGGPWGPPRHVVGVTWTSPAGVVIDLMQVINEPQVLLRPGVDGFGAAPREVQRQSLATGGGYGRWSHVAERIITLPMSLHADTPEEFLALRRQVTTAFTSTTPAAGEPRPGLLRVTRSDGNWREIEAIYLDGLGWADEPGMGATDDIPVVELVAPDPWWRGETQYELEFAVPPTRDYLNPYETVSPDRTLGGQIVTIAGDAPALPVWKIYGPADSVTARYANDGPGWTFGEVGAGEVITIDVDEATVTDNTGTNRVGNLAWPTSTLFPIAAGENDLLLSMTGGLAGTSKMTLSYQPRWETA